MTKLKELIKKKLSRQLTIILIPHSPTKTRKISFSLSFLLSTILFWTGITIWAGYINAKHIDYWRTRLSHQIIEMKLTFFANQVKETQEYIEQVKQKDEQLRELLEMKSKKAILINSKSGQGGPQLQDRVYLDKLLSGKISELSINDFNYQVETIRAQTNELLESYNEIVNYISFQRSLYVATPNMWPTKGRITSTYGFRIHPVTGKYEFHSGLDIANEKKTKIHATAEGTVEYVGWCPGYGKLCIIDHGYGFKTIYAHCCEILARKKQKVDRGNIIALMGDSGTSTGNHVHYEVQYNGRTLNPLYFLDKDNFFAKKSK